MATTTLLHTDYQYIENVVLSAQIHNCKLQGPDDKRAACDVLWGINMWGRKTCQGGRYRACLAPDTIQPELSLRKLSVSHFALECVWKGPPSPPPTTSAGGRAMVFSDLDEVHQQTLEDLHKRSAVTTKSPFE